jgi:7-cyano-7-deazaguanine synthase
MKTGILLSGGMDSAALSWWKRPDIAFTIDYGQLAANAEMQAATTIANRLAIEHHIIAVDCSALGSGDMAGNAADTNAPASDWWPYRNQLLVTLTAMKAIGLGVNRVLLGTVKSDGFHRDGTIEFIDALSKLLEIQEGALCLQAPAIDMSTVELVRLSGITSAELAWCHSCHKSNVSCGNCRGCYKYFNVFEEIGYELD